MHVERNGSFTLPSPPERTLEWFTPEGERLWVPGWKPETLHTPGADLDVEGAVFRTAATGEETLWIVLRLDRAAGIAEYARITPGNRLGTVHVRSTPGAEGGTEVDVTYRLTALSEAGEAVLGALTEAAYAEMLADWRTKVAALAAA
ncbi:MAG TPA: SRPBCC family protein [Thermoanaerobaculia bacterium]|nr:SRPBCC family protein [Thermoanaerobaculia bacterium]